MTRHRYLAPDLHLKGGLKLIGAKAGQKMISTRDKFYQIMPDADMYLEPFLGSASVVVGKPKHGMEAVNDISPWTMNFFKCLVQYPNELWDSMQDAVWQMSPRKFRRLRSKLRGVSNFNSINIDMAGCFYAINKFANNGIFRHNASGECNSSYCKTREGRGLFDWDWLCKVRDRMKDVQLYNLDWQEFFEAALGYEEWHKDRVLAFVDPPYFEVETAYYQVWKKPDHIRLGDFLALSKFQFVLTYNDHPQIRKWYREFNINKNETHWACSNTSKGRGTKTELIITNFDYDIDLLRPSYLLDMREQRRQLL